MSIEEGGVSGHSGGSSSDELDDLNFLNFSQDVDWSSTLVLRCDPAGAPYKLIDIANALHTVVRRNDVHNLVPTALNYVFTISFKTDRSTDNFVRFLKNERNQQLTVKNHRCVVLRIPTKTVTLNIRWIPTDIDTAHIVDVLKQYGTIVKTDLVRNERQGWFHVYTGERRFQILLHDDVDIRQLPYTIVVKGLIAAVNVAQRNPKCLDCYYTGHQNETCRHRGCILYRED